MVVVNILLVVQEAMGVVVAVEVAMPVGEEKMSFPPVLAQVEEDLLCSPPMMRAFYSILGSKHVSVLY